jgi:hypothetical protein
MILCKGGNNYNQTSITYSKYLHCDIYNNV